MTEQELIEKVKNKKLAQPELGEQCWFYTETDLKEIIALIRQHDKARYDRLVVLAIKHCPPDHHDWNEIKELVAAIEGVSDD